MASRGKSSILRIVVLIVASAFLVGFAGRPERGDLSTHVWYCGQRVPFGELLDRGVVPQCHDGMGRGIITCYDTKEELAAATGVGLAGVDRDEVERLRSSGTVAQVQGAWYACLHNGIDLTGDSFLLMYDYANLRDVLFDNITSSIEIPTGAGYSSYYTDPDYAGISWAFYTTKTDLRPYGLDNVISSVRRGYY
ncbi:MAG: hypothetical protein GXX94_01005 [Chloroflexi bacterium]|nr:hypothetical protein [Chloroflexota bacterium]